MAERTLADRVHDTIANHTILRDGHPTSIGKVAGPTALREVAEAVMAEVQPELDERDAANERYVIATGIEMRVSQALTEALELDPRDADACVPGCEDGPQGIEHDLYHLVAQRNELRAERDRLRAALAEIRDRHRRHGDRCSSCDHRLAAGCDTCGVEHPCWHRRVAEAALTTDDKETGDEEWTPTP